MTITRGHGKEIDSMIEQAYRRGYHQGFSEGIALPAEKHAIAGKKIYEWRHSRDDGFVPPPCSGLGEKI